MKILLKNGTIVNGDGKTPAFRADLLVDGQRIAKIGENLRCEGALQLDLAGDYLTPGFIDAHSHLDLAYFVPDGLAGKLQQGITSELTGQCGLGVHPMPKNLQAKFRKGLLIGDLPIKWNWESSAEYLQALQNTGLSINNAPAISHGVLRYTQQQDSNLPLSDQQIEKICELAEAGFCQGIKFLTFGFIYLPALYYRKNEVLALLKVAAAHGAIACVHLKSESDKILQALSEIATLASQAGCRLHISHLKIIGRDHAKFLPEIFALLEKFDLTFDNYFYNNGCTLLASLLPPEFMDPCGLEATCQKLHDSHFRQKIKNAIEKNESALPWDNLYKFLGAENIYIDSLGKNTKFIGKNLAELQLADDPLESMLLLLAQEKGHILMKDYFCSLKVTQQILQHPRGVFSTDSLPLSTHPRGFVTFPRILKKAVFSQKLLSLEEAIYKMSGKTAEIFGLEKRGKIKEGYYADLVSFSPQIGYHQKEVENLNLVIVNGVLAKSFGKMLPNKKTGKILLK